MKVLLDTHSLLWWLVDSSELSAKARREISDSANDIYVSAASAWEIATKSAKGKLEGVEALLADFGGTIRQQGMIELGISASHMILSAKLPGAHRDPFDRILAAQAILENAVLLTRDKKIEAFGATALW